MKKLLTLFALLIMAGAMNAQSSKEEARRIILGDRQESGRGNNDRDVVLGRNDDYKRFPSSERDYRLDEINREYDQKIRSIENNRLLSAEEKRDIIRQLEKDRKKKINALNRGRKDDYKRDRKDNGKHKGWYKQKSKKHERDDDRR